MASHAKIHNGENPNSCTKLYCWKSSCCSSSTGIVLEMKDIINNYEAMQGW